MRFGIIANMGRPDAEKVLRRLIAWSVKNKVTLNFCDSMSKYVEADQTVLPRRELPENSDVIISLGGDGTLLATARAVGRHGTPILGINLGSLGFLTQLTPVDLEDTLSAVLKSSYKLEKRMVVEVVTETGPEIDFPYALNEVVVDRGSVSRIINLDLYANDYFVCSYAADGLIISTPTGSTAYSLAVGGPIINPLMDVFIIAPISPFSLTVRPIIFSAEDEIRILVRSSHSDPVLTLDGQVDCNLTQEASFIIRRADFCINFIVFRINSFYDVLRSKLHWGRLPEGNPRSPKYF